tara:strand:- start:8030 stop:8368 length:339 start_codon:yes stop_codon:yes gene_type:complete
MKPMKVEAGEKAPDLEALLKEAKVIADQFDTKVGNLFQNVTGVEAVKTGYFDTNQRHAVVEDVKRTDPKKEEINLDAMQHSSHDNALPAHENSEGDKSDKNPVGAYNLTDYY